jgi:protein-tyrosine phosphatase
MSSVLFLCTGNYYRSRFAEDYFNHGASRRGLIWRAVSRGLARDMGATGNVGPMAADACETLRALDIDPAGANRYPVAAVAADFEVHVRIVALGRSISL